MLTPSIVREHLTEAPPEVLVAALDRHSSDASLLLACVRPSHSILALFVVDSLFLVLLKDKHEKMPVM